MSEEYLCFDIGGTNIKYAIITADGNFKYKALLATEAQNGAKSIIAKIKNIAAKYKLQYNLQGIAISTAGIVDQEKGSIIYAFPEIFPGYSNTPLKRTLEDDCNLPCTVENDVNCAALGETWLGCARGTDSAFMMTIGTSVGGCIILDGKIIHGGANSAGEIAYMNIPQGNFHDIVSTTYLVNEISRQHNNNSDEFNGKAAFEMIANGDKIANIVLDKMLQSLLYGINNVCSILNPKTIILGGGIMQQKELLQPRIDYWAKKILPAIFYQNTQIKFAELGNDAGVLGALYYHLNN